VPQRWPIWVTLLPIAIDQGQEAPPSIGILRSATWNHLRSPS
jgi:hypothetical protein